MIRRKIILVLILSVIFTFSFGTCDMFAFASSPKITIENADANPGDEVEISIKLTGNPGITSLDYLVKYDSDTLSLKSVNIGSLIPKEGYISSQNITNIPYYMGWINSLEKTNSDKDGVLATLTFIVDENAKAGKYEIEIAASSGSTVGKVTAYTANLDAVYFDAVSGHINVKGANESSGQQSYVYFPPLAKPDTDEKVADSIVSTTDENVSTDISEQKEKPSIAKKVEAMSVKVSKSQYSKSKKTVTLNFKKTNSKIKVDGYQIYRSTKKSSGYKRIKTTTSTKYTDKSVKKNKTYYYKIRGYRTVEGKKYYTKYSSKIKVVTK